MNARPKEPPHVVLELGRDEAAALHRALGRAEEPVAAAGNHLDVRRFATLREALAVALRGGSFTGEVES
jgi:hypothetical protein